MADINSCDHLEVDLVKNLGEDEKKVGVYFCPTPLTPADLSAQQQKCVYTEIE